jgi:RNA polymerase sigma-B factor
MSKILSAERRPPRRAREHHPSSERAGRDRRLLVRYHRHGDLGARDELVARFLPLARRLARRYSHMDELQEDLEQVACVGLIKAIDRYDIDRGYTLSSYAVPTILGELKRHFRDTGWSAHVPRVVQERILSVNQALDRLSTELGRSPTLREVAGATRCTVEEVLEAKEAAPAYASASLEAPAPRTEDGEGQTYADTLGLEEQGYELVELGQAIGTAMRRLTQQERYVLHLRFVEDLTQVEIAKRIGVSQMQVSRILRSVLDRLRTASEADLESVDALRRRGGHQRRAA